MRKLAKALLILLLATGCSSTMTEEELFERDAEAARELQDESEEKLEQIRNPNLRRAARNLLWQYYLSAGTTSRSIDDLIRQDRAVCPYIE